MTNAKMQYRSLVQEDSRYKIETIEYQTPISRSHWFTNVHMNVIIQEIIYLQIHLYIWFSLCRGLVQMTSVWWNYDLYLNLIKYCCLLNIMTLYSSQQNTQ